MTFVVLSSADFKQSPPNIQSPNINMRKRRHGEEEIYYIPVRAFQISDCNKKMQCNEITSKHREILHHDVLFMCCPCVQVRGRDNFELLMKIKDSLELVDLVPQPLLDSYRQQTQQQLLQRP